MVGAEPWWSLAPWLGATPLENTVQFLMGLAWLLLPGLMLAWAWTPPGKARSWLLVWGVCASLTWLALTAVVLHAVDALRASGWLASAAIWGVFALVWRYRRTGRVWPRTAAGTAWPRVLPQTLKRVQPVVPALAVAVALVIVAFGLARQGADEAAARPMTEFWVQPSGQELLVGVRNREGRPMNYRIELRDGMQTLQVLRVDGLRALETRELRIARPRTAEASGQILQVPLFRDGDAKPYRHLTLAR